ncbi:acetylcholine receptor subunit alpha-type unc-38-like [Mytilus trossulus]|uniref:acetylcholine receptor subunit alpha-type unc-38-like n=1 Tax=Mytilus trossulus TaxID=6551 RepID=UPI0030069460
MPSNTGRPNIFSIQMLLLVATTMIIAGSTSSEYEDAQNLHAFLMANYSRILTPRFNQSESVDVILSLFLNSVIDFHPVSGVMTFSAAFIIKWRDEIIEDRWQNSGYVDINVTKIAMHNVWLPKIYIRNIANIGSVYQFLSTVDSEMSFVTYTRTGEAIMTCLAVLQTMCQTDVTFYPIDEHTCDITMITINDYQAINLQTTDEDVVNELTYQNSEWTLTSVVTASCSDKFSEVNFAVNLTRKPVFFVTNLVFPIMIITVVNGLSFFVPIESGERLSFGTSLLLMFIVFLTTVIDVLPSTDNELSYFNIFVFIELNYSCFIVFGIISTLFLYHRSTTKKVPKLLKRITLYVLKIHKTLPVNIDTISNMNTPSTNCTKLMDLHEQGDDNQIESVNDEHMKPKVSWRDVSIALDKVLKTITTFFTVCLLLVFILFHIWIEIRTKR